ncbi:sulfur carrier protein [Mumia flava]|uniref:Sulfur carrier protein n=1 Tax=Mumia flava TaxID=1348852 RepID=A0A0B2BPR6_9ACTN|nr:sulfur carrier protein ThiS [Mumia flava]PJJ57012.1 sulfur carrier protein [Mumia flava]
MSVQVNGEDRDLATPITVADLLVALALPRRDVAVAVDGAVVPRSTWESAIVDEESEVEVVTAVQGG